MNTFGFSVAQQPFLSYAAPVVTVVMARLVRGCISVTARLHFGVGSVIVFAVQDMQIYGCDCGFLVAMRGQWSSA